MADLPTRDRVIAHHVGMALRHTELTRDSFSDCVVQRYHERTPLHLRHVEFHAVGRGVDPYAVLRANAQLLFRQIDGTVRFTSELEEAVVLSLPEPYRRACLCDLAARYGLLAAEQPAVEASAQLAQVGSLAKEFGEALQAISRTYADGLLDANDAANAADVVRQLDELMAATTTLRASHAAIVAGATQPTTPPAGEGRY